MSTSIHWFALGTSYWGRFLFLSLFPPLRLRFWWLHLTLQPGTRLVVQKSWEREGEELSPTDKIKASAIAGGAAGVAGGLIGL